MKIVDQARMRLVAQEPFDAAAALSAAAQTLANGSMIDLSDDLLDAGVLFASTRLDLALAERSLRRIALELRRTDPDLVAIRAHVQAFEQGSAA